MPVEAELFPRVEARHRAVVPLQASAPLAPLTEMRADELTERLAWRLPRLDFSETTLEEATAMFNRHNHTVQLRVQDPAVAGMSITGVFRSNNVEGFVRALEASFDIRAERDAQGILLRSAR